MNPFTKQGQALPVEVRNRIIFLWREGQNPSQIGFNLNLKRQTVTNIVNNFVTRGTAEALKGGNTQRHARTDDVCEYIEYCKQRQPSVFAKELQHSLVENNVCLQQNVPSQSTVSRCLKSDLGYSYKKLKVIPRESLTPQAQDLLERYLAAVCSVNIRTLHFFDECSVVKTTGNRHYGHSGIGTRAIEIQRYASNATYTVNLLHNVYGIGHVNILPGPSNGLELLNFFAEAIEEQDVFDNPILKEGDTIVMDNCGFHHARHVEPVLRDMLANRGLRLVYQPPYHPEYNTCEMCFRHLKGVLRSFPKFAEEHTEIAILHGLSKITHLMSRNIFKYCGYTDD
ncbi:Paired box pox-meso [Paramuricea clavata]|uniref:Paired box pox-meso n=1 Tax=Paramuricea clavata TaxID=317549 RepID=A0A6S7L2X9_PARCT|nr:Paired box pox-meso [Paramuricea clavata]